MNPSDPPRDLNRVTEILVDCAYRVHAELGPGLLETVYEVLLAHSAREAGLRVERQVPMAITFENKRFDEGFRADLFVEGCVIVEVKSVEQLARVHKKQVLTYLRLSGCAVGLLINFGGELLKGNIERIVHGNAPDLKASAMRGISHGGHEGHGDESGRSGGNR